MNERQMEIETDKPIPTGLQPIRLEFPAVTGTAVLTYHAEIKHIEGVRYRLTQLTEPVFTQRPEK